MLRHRTRPVKDKPSTGSIDLGSDELMSTHTQVPSANGRTIPALAAGAFAIGAFAIGALAIGSLAIGQLVIGRARIRRLAIDKLVVGELLITESVETPPEHTTD